jgi:hypothetical protein
MSMMRTGCVVTAISLAILTLGPVTSHATPVLLSQDSASGFVFTVAEEEATLALDRFAFGNFWPFSVSWQPHLTPPVFDTVLGRILPTSLVIDWNVVHDTQIVGQALGTLWETGFDVRVEGPSQVTTSATFLHPGATFPGGATGPHLDQYVATLAFGLGPEGTGIQSWLFTLTGKAVPVSVPEPSSLLLSSAALLGGMAWMRKRTLAQSKDSRHSEPGR